MQIKDLFLKDIFRPINNVVQAEQIEEDVVKTELDEYVLTEESEHYLERFYRNYLAVYDQPSTKVGVWISGFFGSGKSHFLKILSYLLHNQTITGKTPADYFQDKTDNQELLNMMKQVSKKRTDALLFNIDSRSTSSSKDAEKERIIEVFLRVFNNHLGYSDTLWIADMERQLDNDGAYEAFKKAIHDQNGSAWEEFRLKIKLRKKKVIQALETVGYDADTAESFFIMSREWFSIDADSVAQLIADYCKKQGPDYRIVFLADEVGQYVGNNTNLMLNLQTITERLGDLCHGQAWVIVTSQEKLEATVSDLDSTKDFSKIQGRFETKINLSSANTDEVIKKRLLEKEDIGADTLKTIHDQEGKLIHNRLAFDKQNTQLRSGYRSIDEFVEFYPFVPYQIELLQKIFTKIRNLGEGGQHTSRGERSLLKAFQEAAQLNAEEKVDNMVTMAEFYPSIRDYLESSITSTISRAQDRARNNEGLEEYDVKVLQVLYLIKGIDDIKSTPNNIATLMVETVYDERQPLEYRIKKSLNRLQMAMFIEQHADGSYSFLSDEEQEINREIKGEDYNSTAVKKDLGDLFFRSMYSNIKYEYKYKDQSKHFDYNKRFDNYVKGQMNHELTMQVFSEGMTDSEAALQANSGHLIILLNKDLVAEAEGALAYIQQVESYVRRKQSGTTSRQQKRIYEAKIAEVDEYADKAEELLSKACENAEFYIQGQHRDFSGTFESKVNQAMDMLIRNTFTKFHYIEEPISFKNSKKEWMQVAENLGQQSLFSDLNKNAIDEVKHFIEELERSHDQRTLKEVVQKYKAVPFGWEEQDTIGILMGLMNAGKVRFTYAGESFNPNSNQFYDRLEKVSERDRILLLPIVEMDHQVKHELIALVRDFFSNAQAYDTYDAYEEVIRKKVEEEFLQPIEKIRERRRQQDSRSDYPYPGESDIRTVVNDTQKLLSIRDPEQFCRAFIQYEDDIENWYDILETLQGFYEGNPITKFDEAVQALNDYKQDLEIIHNEELEETAQRIKQILLQEEPTKEISQLPKLTDVLKNIIQEETNKQKQAVMVQSEKIFIKLENLIDQYNQYESIEEYIQSRKNQATQLHEKIKKSERISSARINQQQLNELFEATKIRARQMLNDLIDYSDIVKRQPKKITEQELYNSFFTHMDMIESEEDLERAIESLKKSLIKELQTYYFIKV
ncbi:BREX system P-loop protein BrxC [Cytobacillus kochii]|uniref:BREX system P-loop protein BrxC n=1 Tax=Cytobacillus kochii TaxID=859143 RepID=UPI001CD79F74|nr:BREX system P-loop protein BrxC [Cytobacillus kochii]MCA1026595.1 BREX system P-loop protein BrxC [Cytobacillus kochii]